MRHSILLAALVASAASLSACVVAPAYPTQDAYYGGGPVVVANAPPPAPYVETVPVAPYPGAIWIGGYWGWSGGRHTWVAGHYEHGRPGYAWSPHHWEHRGGDRWELHGGGWVRH